MAIQRIPVESSDLVAIGYDQKARILEIEFKEGRVYQYSDVPPDVHQQFMRADSYGEYFFTAINKRYRYHKIGADTQAGGPKALAIVTDNDIEAQTLESVCTPFEIAVERLVLPVIEVQSDEAQYIATQKAKHAYKLARRPVVVSTTHWNILALRGFPGAYMRQMTEWLRVEDFLALMQGKTDRTFVRTHTVVYYDGKHAKVCTQDFTGVLLESPQGEGKPIERLTLAPDNGSAWPEFARWYHMRRRLGKV